MINVLNGYVSQGPGADRIAYVPNPTTPAVGPLPNIIWQDTDGDGAQYWWDIANAVWVESIPGTIGTVTTLSVATANGFAGSVADPTTTPEITIETTFTGIAFSDGSGGIQAAIAGDFPTLNQNTTGSAATLTTPRAIYGSNFDGSAAITGPVGPTFGGTGITSYATGDLLYASATNVLSKLAAGTNTYVLTMTGGVPVWAAPSGGGSGTVNSGTVNQLAYYASTGTAVSGLTSANSGFLVTSSSGVPSISSTVPNHTVTPSSGATTLTLAGLSAQNATIFWNGATSTIARIGQAGSANQIINGSTIDDLMFWLNGTGRMIFSTASGTPGIGFGLETSNGGISWGGSTSGTVPVKSNLTVFPASGNASLIIQAAASAQTAIRFKANNDAFAVSELGQAGSNGQFLSSSVAGDVCLFINGNSQRFLIGTASGGAVGFGVATANGGIFTNAPSGGTSANWHLGTVASVSPTSPNRTIELAINGTTYYLAAKTTND